MLLYAFWVIRFRWLTMRYVEAQKPCLLEIRLPKEITKSPAAMEIFFSYLRQSGAGNYGEAFIDGETRPWFSCELVSSGGEVRFYIWCSNAKKYKNILETQLYAQYPNIEIYEVDDYTSTIDFDMEKYNLSGVQYKLIQPDPLPIKTYMDYGLDSTENLKEEYKIDPITSVIEFLGSLKTGENVWIQILIQKHEKEGFFHGKLNEGKDLKAEIKKEIEKIKEKSISKKSEDKSPNLSRGDLDVISAIERSATKTPFDCMIRSIYIAEKTVFNTANIGGMIGGLRQYSSNNLNGFAPKFSTAISDNRKDITRVLPFLKKFNQKKLTGYKKDIFYAYKLRSFFQWPYKNYGKCKPFILTTEELATIFHFPSGMVSQTPTLQRVGSKKSEAPSNLPI